jgi:AcrR family transcriptional regulator
MSPRTTKPARRTKPDEEPPKDSPRRDDLLDAALKLFRVHGFRATGIDSIIEAAGVAKMTLYHHFDSKEDLILAALRRRDDELKEFLTRRVTELASTPRERLLAVYDALGEWLKRDKFAGCLFIKAAAEFPELDHPIHRAAAEHKSDIRAVIRALAAEAGARDPDELAAHLCLLVQGAIIHSQIRKSIDPVHEARAAAELFVRTAMVR